jgi:hypothetical protein
MIVGKEDTTEPNQKPDEQESVTSSNNDCTYPRSSPLRIDKAISIECGIRSPKQLKLKEKL